jgi:carbonic anhydrase
LNRQFYISVTFNPNDNIKRFIFGGDLPGRYIFCSGHFHWGGAYERGSEHTIDGRSFPLEYHAVHYKEEFSNTQDAINSGKSDALAVLAVLLQVRLFDTIMNEIKLTYYF